MIHHQCLVSVLLALPLFGAADPIPEHSQLGLPEHEAKAIQMFNDFALTYKKQYASEEEFGKRFTIFKRNLQEIDRLNREEAGTAEYGVNKFADLTYEEFVRGYTGSRIPAEEMKRHVEAIEDGPREEIVFTDYLNDDSDDDDDDDDDEENDSGDDVALDNSSEEDGENIKVVDGKVYLPKRIDYRKRKAVTPVKDQGNCGSCWAFSAITNVEGQYAKRYKKLHDLSPQELLDCDTIDGACDGGWMANAIMESIRLGGFMNSTAYPYHARKEKCIFKKSDVVVKATGNKALPRDEDKIAKQLVESGPISVAVVASVNFQFYKKGIFDPTPSQCSTSPTEVDHGVTLVGYGVQKKIPFWVIKNSWGKVWGDKGYMRLSRGKKSCAVHSYASTALV